MKFWNWLKSFFVKNVVTPIIIKVPNPPVIPGVTNTDACVVIGHNIFDKGAKSFNGISEYIWNEEVSKHIKYPTLFRDETLSYFGQCMKIAEAIEQGGYKYVICMHFNKYNFQVQGTETFYMRNPSFGIMAQGKLVKYTGLNDRGAKYADRGRTMIEAIENAGAKCILVEPFFGDEKQCEELLKNHKQYAEVINEILDTAVINKL